MKFLRFIKNSDGRLHGTSRHGVTNDRQPALMTLAQLRYMGDKHLAGEILRHRAGLYDSNGWNWDECDKIGRRLKKMSASEINDVIDGFSETFIMLFVDGTAYQIPLSAPCVRVLCQHGEFARPCDIEKVTITGKTQWDAGRTFEVKSLAAARAFITRDISVTTRKFKNKISNHGVLLAMATNRSPHNRIDVVIHLKDGGTITVNPIDLLITSAYSRKTIRKLMS